MTEHWNLLTDVAGIRVGHADDARLASGVTAILVEQPNVASVVIRGGAPGGRDIGLLEPEMTVAGVDAIVLSGGSAFGLDAAGGVMGFLREAGIGLKVGGVVVPIVAQAIVFDLLNGGDKSWAGRPPYWDLGYAAATAATPDRFALGTTGGGFGATTATLKGGLGSASCTTSDGITVGAIAVVNAIGTATVGDRPHFWAAPVEAGAEFGGLGLPAPLTAGRPGPAHQRRRSTLDHHLSRRDRCDPDQGRSQAPRAHGRRRARPRHPPRTCAHGRRYRVRRRHTAAAEPGWPRRPHRDRAGGRRLPRPRHRPRRLRGIRLAVCRSAPLVAGPFRRSDQPPSPMTRWIMAAALSLAVAALLVWQWSRERQIEACVRDGGVWHGATSRCEEPAARPILKRGIERG